VGVVGDYCRGYWVEVEISGVGRSCSPGELPRLISSKLFSFFRGGLNEGSGWSFDRFLTIPQKKLKKPCF